MDQTRVAWNRVDQYWIRLTETNKILPHGTMCDLLEKAIKGNVKARELMVRSHIRFVISIVHRYRCEANSFGIDLNDLVVEGCVGVNDAINQFNRNKGIQFTSYAGMWVRARIKNLIKSQRGTVRFPDTLVKQKKLRDKAKESIRARGETPDTEEKIQTEIALIQKRKVCAQLAKKLKRTPHEAEISEAINERTKKDLAKAQAKVAKRVSSSNSQQPKSSADTLPNIIEFCHPVAISLDELANPDDSHRATRLELLVSDQNLEEDYIMKELRVKSEIAQAMTKIFDPSKRTFTLTDIEADWDHSGELSRRHVFILCLRLGLGASLETGSEIVTFEEDETLTLEKVGKFIPNDNGGIGITRERVRKLEKKLCKYAKKF